MQTENNIETLENEIVEYWSAQPVGMPVTVIGAITASLIYLSRKGYINVEKPNIDPAICNKSPENLTQGKETIVSDKINQSFGIPAQGIFQHIRTGDNYRVLAESFDVQTQRPHVVYVSMKTGAVFNRDKEIFNQNFSYVTDVIIEVKEPKS